MNFQNLTKVESAQFYLDVAFKQARVRAGELKEGIATKARRDMTRKAKLTEQIKIDSVEKSIVKRLRNILEGFPSLDMLPEFYNQLVKITIDYPNLKKSLGALNWSVKRIEEMSRIYSSKVMKSSDIDHVKKASKEFYGRISSIVKQIDSNLRYLEQARRTMKAFPAVKTSLFTVALFGFPNIGKTTLLSKLTGSTPEINSYAFTTKNLNIGYFTIDGRKIQVIDTPGSLNRFEKKNALEQQAYLALKHCTHLVVFIVDLTEPYPLKDQMKLRNQLRGKSVVTYLTKKDIIDPVRFREFKKEQYLDDPIELKRSIALCAESYGDVQQDKEPDS